MMTSMKVQVVAESYDDEFFRACVYDEAGTKLATGYGRCPDRACAFALQTYAGVLLKDHPAFPEGEKPCATIP